MSLEENFETYLKEEKEKYANEEDEQNTETDNPNFRVGFLIVLTLRIWRASIIHGLSAWLKSFPSLWAQRYNKYLTILVVIGQFSGPYRRVRPGKNVSWISFWTQR